MRAPPFSIVGFDLDGTLVDTVPDLAGAVNHVLAQAGRAPLDEDTVRGLVGGGTRHMLELALAKTGGADELLLERLLPELLSFYEAHIADASRPFPGAGEALRALRAEGVRLAVVTNKIGRLSRRLLEAVDLLDLVDTVIGGDEVERQKPDSAPLTAMVERLGGGRAAFVGDSIYDMAAARAAALPAVAVSFGYRDRPAEALGADALIDSFAELLPALEKL
ncbi:phosphoglycolate phosphatase [Sphingomonas aracearum]|uniref:Phosphoglycolate phosphatase n=1 Tax=Sphingomonas aracearum TaxID=2283317 RepID=A0A369VXE9_9SPHN|nr:phosphoglycolate phosphatase [Sphingomonas aracearum]RDE06998.1 phosphoglycolate phosphatase [Sphingomonas aracearum]